MTSNDRHASHDSPYRTGQHVPLNQSRHAPLTSVATSALESRQDLTSPYNDDTSGKFTPALQNGSHGAPDTPGAGPLQSPSSPYSPGMRSHMALQRQNSKEVNPFDAASAGEIQMQDFQEGLPPPPPVSHSWKRIDRWAEDHYEELYDQLSEGATQNDVNELEHELDCSLPMEVRESLQVHDGQERGGRPTGIIFGCMLLDCEEIVQEWKNWRTVNEEYLTTQPSQQGSFGPKAFAASSSSSIPPPAANPLWRQQLLDRQDSQPPRAIQKAYAHHAWIPLARDWGGNNVAIDLAPGPVGQWGQVIIFGRDYDCKYVVARSWAAFLAMVADDMQSERVFVDEETQELKLREFKTTSVEPAYLDILRWRMDQKYGRKGPQKRPGPIFGHGGPRGPGGSPYGSPTEERGRSPQRFPQRPAPSAGSTSSPRGGGIGRPSPLGIVSEENNLPKLETSTDDKQDPFAKNTTLDRTDSNLMDINTPTSTTNDKGIDQATAPKDLNVSAVLVEKTNSDKSPPSKATVTGLGVEGVDDMKTVEI